MRDKGAVPGFDRREHRVCQHEISAAPHEQAAADLDAGAEVAVVPGGAVHPVGGDHDVRVQLAGAPAGAVLEAHAGFLGMTLQHCQQLGPRDPDEFLVIADPGGPPGYDHRHVVLVAGAGQVAQRIGVSRRQLALDPGGQAHPESERRVRRPLLVHRHLAGRVPQLEQAGGIKTAGAAAEHRDAA